jgi:ABC-type uncharacterized transport system YnjBCD ATPase subunit|tara:strand:+ start:26 stop:328 length:303 start_codon:yes stop_codon:yes gene_type:complete
VVEVDMMKDHTLKKEVQVDLVVVMVVVHKPKVVQMQEVPLKEILVVLEDQIHQIVYLLVAAVVVPVVLVLITILELLVVMVDLVDWVDKFQQHLEILHQE